MAWTTPRTWVTGELVTAALMNTHVRDNLNHIINRPQAVYDANEGTNLTGLNSTSFANVDDTEGNFKHTITLATTNAMVGVSLLAGYETSQCLAYFDVSIDGTRHSADDGIQMWRIDNDSANSGQRGNTVAAVWLLSGLSTGSRIFRLMYKVSAQAITIFRGAGTSAADVHPQFWVREA